MELNHDVVTEAPRASATVVLLRDDRGQGLEVLLLRRHTASAVLGGAYVFPGGKLDEADCAEAATAPLADEQTRLQAALAEPDLARPQALGLFVAAARELEEECGVRMPASALQPWTRWITPVQPSVTNKRFDTRFFVAALPSGQEPQHDNVEAVDTLWVTPRDALQRYWAREISLAPPQIMTLASLVAFEGVHDVMAHARGRRPPCIQPEPFDDDQGVRTLCYPGDARHSVSQRAMPGPTRLRYNAGRFEPVDGLPALLDPVPL
jgi:8-oxo-dGTP pyrophosphatase MutT (NUDIX family)